MKYYRIYLAIAGLVLGSLACQAMAGGRGETATTTPAAPADSTENNGNNNSTSTDFPITEDAYNIIDVGDGSVIFYTKLSLEDVMQFYRDEYTSRGYTEREMLTVLESGTFNMVFDGDPSGMSVVIQSVDLGDGSCTVTLRLEDI